MLGNITYGVDVVSKRVLGKMEFFYLYLECL